MTQRPTFITLAYEASPIRVGLKDGEPYYALSDLMAALRIPSLPTTGLYRLTPADLANVPMGAAGPVEAVTRSGLCKAIVGAPDGRAGPFLKWMVSTGLSVVKRELGGL